MRKFLFVLIHFVLIGQVYELSAYKIPLLGNIYHAMGRPIGANSFWWSTHNAKPQHVHRGAGNQDVHGSAVIKLQKKIGKYAQYDPSLQELDLKLRSYTENIKKYKTNELSNIDDIVLPSTTISAINRYVDAIIANKDTDFSWHMKEYGAIQGAFSCAANLCVPKNVQSCLGAGVSILGLEMLRSRFQSRSTTPVATSNITVNVPANAQLTMHSNPSVAQDIAKMVIICSLVAGTTIAATQWYTSFTSRQHNEDQLALWIQQLQNHNLAMANYGLNKNTNEVLNKMAPQMNSLSDTINEHHHINQEEFSRACDERREMFDACKNLREEYAKWLLDDKMHKSSIHKVTDSIQERLTHLSDKYTIDIYEVKKTLAHHTQLLQEILQYHRSDSETVQE